jgi:stearoyl-CoA desaturase (delta-9 desaturase)
MPGFAVLAEPWWVPVLWIVVIGHITNLCVTLYLHRSATHEGVRFHPVVEHAMRFWLWLTTGMVTKQWVACHRKHHAFSDREGDPHSPVEEGLLEIVFGGVFFYREAVADRDMVEKYGRGCPDDWIERRIYSRLPFLGILTMLAVNLYLFGPAWGLVVWSGMAVWIPIFGNVINGVGHALGYRNFDTKDHSHNIIPLGIWIVGEELHNNHHADPRSAKFKARWFEFDIGWMYIRLLQLLRLADVIYARDVTAREFAEKYYRRASDAVEGAKAAARGKVEEARLAAREAANAASARAREAANAASVRAQEAATAASAMASRARASAREAAEAAGTAAQELIKGPNPTPATD